MSSTLSNIQLGTSVATLDGLAVINADQLFINGQNVNPASPNIPIQPTSSNYVHPIVMTTSFGAQTASLLNVDAGMNLGYNTSTGTLYTNNLYTNGTIYAGGLPTGTAINTIGLNASNQLVKYTPSASTQINLTTLNPSVVIPYYFSLFSSNASGSQTVYIDSATTGLKYLPFTQTFYCNNLNIASVPVGTGVYTLAVDSGGSVVRSTASSTATLMTVYNVNASGYLPIFSVNTGNATANMGYSPSFNLGTTTFTFPGNITGTNITAGNNLYVSGTGVQFSALPLAPPSGTFSGYAALDTAGNVYKTGGSSSQPTITSGTPGSGFGQLLFGSAGVNQTVYVDPNASLQYNLTYASLAFGAGAIQLTSLLSPSPQFVIGSGSAQTQVNLRNSNFFFIIPAAIVATSTSVDFYINGVITPLTPGQVVNVSGITVNTGLNGTYIVASSTSSVFTSTTNPSGYPIGTQGSGPVGGANPIVQYTPINVGNLQFTSSSVLGPTPTAGDNSTKLATTAFVSTALSSISGYLTKTGTQTGINTILQLTAGGNFTLQTSAGTSLLTVINALTTVGNEFKILNTSFPTFNISSSAIGTNRLTQFIETTAGTTYALSSVGDSMIIATNNKWNGVVAGSHYFYIGSTQYMALSTANLSVGAPILFTFTTSPIMTLQYNKFTAFNYSINDTNGTSFMTFITPAPNAIPATTPLITINQDININSAKTTTCSYIVSHSGLPLQLDGKTAIDLMINGSTTAFIQSNQFGIKMGSMFNFSSAGNWNSSNSLFITTGGFGGNNTGVGLGFSSTDNTGYLVSIAPNVSWQAMTYKANTHVFQAAGNSLSVSIDNTNNLILGSTGAGITNNSTTTYGSFHCVGLKNGWIGMSLVANSYYLMANTASGFGLYDQAFDWPIRAIGGDCYLSYPRYIFNNMAQQTYLPNQCVIGNTSSQLQFGVQYSAYYANNGIAWGPGVYFTTFYKASSQSYLRVSGSMSHYISSGGMTSKIIRFYNGSTGGQYDFYLYQYTNFTGNHVSYPIMVQTSSLPAGQYYVYAYAISNIITDVNDSIYLLFEICWA